MNLTGSQIKDTYEGVLNIGATGLTGALQEITDGLGNLLNIQVSDTTINFSGIVTGNIIGTTGAAGATGANGSNGATGATGPAGATGAGSSSPITLEQTNSLVSTAVGATAAAGANCAVVIGNNTTLFPGATGTIVIGNTSVGGTGACDGVIIGNNLSTASQKAVFIGGTNNTLTTGGKQNTLIGGASNQIICGTDGSGDANTVIGGCALTMNGNNLTSAILAGCNNTMNGSAYSTMLGGVNNIVNYGGGNALVAGVSNTMGGVWGVMLGGFLNCVGNGYGPLITGIGNKYSAGNEGGEAMIGGQYNCLYADSGKGPVIIGGENNYYLNSTVLGGGYSYSWGGIFAGFCNQIRGTAPSTAGANLQPIIIGGQSNLIYGEGACSNTNSQAAIINSFSSCITNSTLGTIIGGTGNTISGYYNSVIIGGSLISADRSNTTYVQSLVAEGQAASRAYAIGSTGTAISVDWDNSNVQTLTITASGTLTMSNPIDGGVYTLQITQGGSGSNAITWTDVKWPGGTPPTLSTAVAATDILTFIYGPTAYFGNANLNFS